MAVDQTMTEFEAITAHEFKGQERFEWFRVNRFLQDFSTKAAELNLAPNELIQIGGTAIFYYAYKAFGPRAVQFFRGTHDMDVVSFSSGSVQRVLDALKEDSDSFVVDYFVSGSPLPYKRKISVFLDSKANPGVSSGFVIDTWEASEGKIIFNDRAFSKKKIILDPPEKLELLTLNPQKDRGLVSVPSLRDSFLMKMDIVDYSRLGLRSKDRLDALVVLSIADKLGYPYRDLFEGIVRVSDDRSVYRKLEELSKLYMKPDLEVSLLGENNPLVPSEHQLVRALEEIEEVRNRFD